MTQNVIYNAKINATGLLEEWEYCYIVTYDGEMWRVLIKDGSDVLRNLEILGEL